MVAAAPMLANAHSAASDDETVLYSVTGPGSGSGPSGARSPRSVRSPAPSARSSRDPSRATSRERERGIFNAIDEDSVSASQSQSQSTPSPLNKIDGMLNSHNLTTTTNFDAKKHRDRAVELELKVERVATHRCSAEDVQTLQKELHEWLGVDKAMNCADVQVRILFLLFCCYYY